PRPEGAPGPHQLTASPHGQRQRNGESSPSEGVGFQSPSYNAQPPRRAQAPPPPVSMSRDPVVEAPAFDCHPDLSAPAPYGSSRRWWVHLRTAPRRSFGLSPARPLEGRHGHQALAEGDSLGAMEKVCRQLTYHLSPHSQWRRQGLLKRKPQACLKAVLSAPPSSGTLDLSGIPLSARDMERLCAHLQRHSPSVVSLELGFTELTDEAFLLLLPTLAALPRLETLALNGNRLTRAILKELTDALKDPSSFPSVTWIDLGNNVDIFSLPQPFLVSLRKRCPKQGNLPTILEFGESQASDPPERVRGLGEEEETDDTNLSHENKSISICFYLYIFVCSNIK
uniref:Uncharacterized protein n=1 Tax=Periophthalmus magnuspinnatus TaxID=409849 RepID=A0A3B4BBH0_9GOBI